MLAGGFGLVGVLFKKFECSPAPLILGLVLGPVLEENFRRSLVIAGGDPSIFLSRPISLGFLLLTVGLVVLFSISGLRRRAATPAA